MTQVSYSKLQKTLYDQNVPLDKTEFFRLNKLKKIVYGFVEVGGKKILELGCNDGRLLEEFSAENSCFGVDISGECLQKAAQRGYQTYLLDLEKAALPFEAGYFDVVICSEVLEHVVNTEGVMNEINRVSHQNAILIISFPNSNQPVSILCVLLDITPAYSARIYSPHVRNLTLKLLKHLLKAKGYTLLNAHGTYVYPFTNRFSMFLANAFPRLGEKIIIVAKKEKGPTLLPDVIWNVKDILSLNKKTSDLQYIPNLNSQK